MWKGALLSGSPPGHASTVLAVVQAAKRVLTKSMAHTNGPRQGTHCPTNIFLRDEGTCRVFLAGSLKVFCLFQIKQI